MNYKSELKVAIEAVLKASQLCQKVQAELVSSDTVTKKDRSPVTIADFGSQAVVNLSLMSAFPDDPIVGEEAASELRENSDLRSKVIKNVAAIFPNSTEDQILTAIDHGSHGGGATGRFWTIDPIDGTKGFLRGGQYAVALALIEEGKVVLGILGCPNLPLDWNQQNGKKGCLFAAIKEEGAIMRSLDDPTETPIHTSQTADSAQASFCESVESAHSSHSDAEKIAKILNVTTPPIRIDSQCKYATVGRGDASIYLRMPTRTYYQENIWDHAAGLSVITEAGGKVTDVYGQPLDFSIGQKLSRNTGVIVTNGKLHDQVLAAVEKVLAGEKE